MSELNTEPVVEPVVESSADPVTEPVWGGASYASAVTGNASAAVEDDFHDVTLERPACEVGVSCECCQ